MAELASEAAFGQAGGYKYPWDEWADGQVRRAVRGEDFEVDAAAFTSNLHQAARKRSMKVRTKKENDGGSVIFQFYREN